MIMIDFSRVDPYDPQVAARETRSWGGRRAGAGRPTEVRHPVRFTFDLEKDDLDELKAVASERGQSVAKIVREAVRGYLGREGGR